MGTITIHAWFLVFLLGIFALFGAVTYAILDRFDKQSARESAEICLTHIKILLESILREIKRINNE